MDIVAITAILASFFLLIGLAEPLAVRMRLPFTVMLAVLGIVIGVGAVFFLRTDLTDALNPVAEAILALPIRSNVFLYVFLPTLIFQATLGMNLRRILDDWVPIFVLAVLAVFVATAAVGYSLYWIGPLPLAACLLVGAIVSTTDPSAVVDIFRSITAPQRLARIIEGESLMNDAAAIALFGLFMGFVMLGVPDPSMSSALTRFPLLILGGALVGWLGAHLAMWVMTRFARHYLAQVSVSVALPYLAFIVAERIIGASGVIAVVASGLGVNLLGPSRLSPETWANMREVWRLLAHWAGALIFILAALLIPRLLGDVRLADLGLLVTVIVAATVSRALILWGLLPLLSGLRLSPQVDPPYRVAILWGGLRGAVTLALALAVTESRLVPAEIKRVVGILATGYTLFTLIAQGTTLRLVIRRLGLDRLTPLDQALANQVVAVALQSVRETVSKLTETYELTHDIVRSEAKRFGIRLDLAIKASEAHDEILARDQVALGLITLAGAERDAILARFRDQTISSRLSDRILPEADRLIEAARSGGRTGYQRAARRSLRYGWGVRLAFFLHNRLRLSRPLANMAADRFELLLMQRMILRDLAGFITGRIRRIHGRRVAELLTELLDRRREEVEQALEGLRLQYPGYAEELERRFIRRTALRLEEREYEAMRDDGLIGEELYGALMQQITSARRAAEQRPKLDLALQKAELVKRLPIFADLDARSLRRLSRALRARYVRAGDTFVRKDGDERCVFFIASGAVELKSAGQTWRLGRGEMFGQMSILGRSPRRSQVQAIAPSTLLVLDESRFRRLLERSTALQEAVRAAARKRGVADALPEEIKSDAATGAAPPEARKESE